MGEITRRLFRHFTSQQSGTASPPRHLRILHPVRTFTPSQRRTAAWPGGEEREKGRRRNSECFPFSQITAFQKAEPLSQKQKIKTYKKKTARPIKSSSLKKEKNSFYSYTYLFLTFSSISSALSISLFSSFGRTILRIIANTAAGTIPEPPKIRLIACGRCTRIAVLEPSP